MSHTATTKKAMIEALQQSLGIVSHAAQAAGIDRRTHYRWYKDDAAYKESVDDISNVALDFAETQLHELIKEKNVIATIFFLKCQGKRRGYVEKQEMGFTNAQGEDFTFNITLDIK
jgi:hypothetical protein